MDRIRRALDLAREERERISNPIPEFLRPAGDPSAVHPSPTTIEYTRTKTFQPDRDVLERNRVIDVNGVEPAAAAFRMLRTQVLQRMDEHQWRSLAVFSPTSADGKTTTAINLAICLANDHRHTVLLVDFDLKHPTVAAKLGIVPARGADDLLRGEGNIEECLHHPAQFDRLVVLPARGSMENSSEALAGPMGRNLVAELRGRYPDRILIYDLPPVLGSDDALAFAPLVECGLVVVAEGVTKRDDLMRSMELLRKTPIVGTVLNRAMHVPSPYG